MIHREVDRLGSRWVAKTLNDVVEFFGVARSTVKDEWRANGIVPKGRGPYDLQAITRRYIERIRRNQLAGRTGRKLEAPLTGEGETKGEGESEGNLLITKLQKQVSKLEEENRKLHRENDLADAKLLPRDEVEAELIQWAVRFRTPLMRLPDKIANRVPGSMKAAVKAEVLGDVHAALQMVLNLQLTSKEIAELIREEHKRLEGNDQ